MWNAGARNNLMSESGIDLFWTDIHGWRTNYTSTMKLTSFTGYIQQRFTLLALPASVEMLWNLLLVPRHQGNHLIPFLHTDVASQDQPPPHLGRETDTWKVIHLICYRMAAFQTVTGMAFYLANTQKAVSCRIHAQADNNHRHKSILGPVYTQ